MQAIGTGKELLEYHVLKTGLTRAEARILEQTLINKSGGIGAPGVLNKINSIAPEKWAQQNINHLPGGNKIRSEYLVK